MIKLAALIAVVVCVAIYLLVDALLDRHLKDRDAR